MPHARVTQFGEPWLPKLGRPDMTAPDLGSLSIHGAGKGSYAVAPAFRPPLANENTIYHPPIFSRGKTGAA